MSSAVKNGKSKLVAIILAFVIVIGAAAAIYITSSRASAQAEALAAEVQERTELAIQADNADKEFFKQAEQQVREAQAAARAEELSAAKDKRDTQVALANEILSSSNGRVLDEGVRDELLASIEAAQAASHSRAIHEAVVVMDSKVEATEQAVEEWEAEQERLAEEARRAEEARKAEEARQAEAARQAASQQSQSANTSRSSDSASPSNSSSGSASNRSSGSSNASANSGGKTARAKDILARHGCSDLSVVWDDPRLAGWNGMYPPGEGTILLNSRIANSTRLNYIVAHECAHHKQHKIYNFDQWTLAEDMIAIYGGVDLEGIEQNADCITRRWGYSEHYYTTSCGGARGDAAQAIMNGRKP